MLRFSAINQAMVGVISSSEDTVYKADNAASPHRPFLPWRSQGLGAQWLTIPVYPAGGQVIQVIALIRTNFTSVAIQGGSDPNSWTNPTYTRDVTVTQNIWNERYHHCHDVVVPAAFPYVHIAIPDQATLDGSPYYLIGGVWIGSWVTMVGVMDAPHEMQPLLVEAVVEPPSKAWQQRMTLGEPLTGITLNRRVTTSARPGTVGLNDELRSWRGMETYMRTLAPYFLLQIEESDPSQCWVARRSGATKWSVDVSEAVSSIDFLEVVGP